MNSTTDTVSMNAALNSCNQTNRIQEEYNRIPDHGWERLYQEIRDKCEREADERNYATHESSKPQNRSLNRYRDVNPYDHSRIVIHRGTVDYINANLVKLERADRKYILTQGPLNDTVGHFWLMVWEQNTRAILMLNKLMEKSQIKCHRYWPCKKGAENAIKLDEVRLTVEYLRCEEYKNYIRRWFKLTDLETSQSREIIQFHYTTWPDFGIPSSPVAFLQFLKQVRDSGALDTNVGPAVVHCSAGIGRSGTFCLVDCCLILIEKEGEDKVSVQDILYELRRYRMGLIQTADQLYFSYKAIIEGIKLLRDLEFLNYQETPSTNCTEDQQPDPFSMDETPPPLPPRTHSLPLPGDADTFIGATRESVTDALNNFISANTISMFHDNSSMTNRPLPPLPGQPTHSYLRHRDELDDSDSDENPFYEDIDDDDSDNDNESGENNLNASVYDDDDNDALDIDFTNVAPSNTSKKREQHQLLLLLQEKTTKTNANNKNDDDNANASNYKNSFGIKTNNDNQGKLQLQNDAIVTTAMSSDTLACNKNKSNGIVGLTCGGTGSDNANRPFLSPENELKRRKRTEREAIIEQKINELKRKRKEFEESQNAAKNRKSWCAYVAAGVIVGLICVYAYSKMN